MPKGIWIRKISLNYDNLIWWNVIAYATNSYWSPKRLKLLQSGRISNDNFYICIYIVDIYIYIHPGQASHQINKASSASYVVSWTVVPLRELPLDWNGEISSSILHYQVQVTKDLSLPVLWNSFNSKLDPLNHVCEAEMLQTLMAAVFSASFADLWD